MLQNRVDPWGKFIKTSARGLWMGNRGVIHVDKKIKKAFNHKAWITCVLEFKERRREVMTPGRWTELFFLDEATAFAAGHRPCFECRRDDAKRFKACWINGNPTHQFNLKTSVKFIDEVIHSERIDRDHKKITHQAPASGLPEGTFFLLDDNAYVLVKGRLHRWTPFGYENSVALPESPLTILTPRSIVNAFRAGYVPQVKM
ncbi:hypothetical protein [Chryseolinea lacunae]|uniref:Uncharacterized protein n=1 Tax=Chryseolinea lacunae TaxID=2801331 RepID=A0ABS1L1X2_9BACT|nr:hypothetical protein [Chryseolinea lacunae]MBL0745680.1 hypothetical protein [Chryseolinea lacunae]